MILLCNVLVGNFNIGKKYSADNYYGSVCGPVGSTVMD